MSFSGFSEDDIRKLTKGQDVNKQKGSNKIPAKKATLKPSHNVNTGTKPKTFSNTNGFNRVSTQELPKDAKLSVSTIPNNVNNIPKETTLEQNNTTSEKESELTIIEETNTSSEKESQPEAPKENRKYKDLDEFEARQKLIEEQNRKRKELLAKALADRTKRTQEEAQRLNEIQEEFKTLDARLSVDVKILRKQIEVASVDYMECQKKYNKIEKEFLEAKLLLHKKQEKKEMLTEHLCTVIEKNEERKAEKLNELIQKLQMSPTEPSSNGMSAETTQEKPFENSQ